MNENAIAGRPERLTLALDGRRRGRRRKGIS